MYCEYKKFSGGLTMKEYSTRSSSNIRTPALLFFFPCFESLLSDKRLSGFMADQLVLEWEVFLSGIEEYCTLPENTKEFFQEEEWISSPAEEHWPFCFENLCKTFGFQSEPLRNALIHIRRKRM